MQDFEIGVISFAFPIALAGIYLLIRQFRRFGAWVQREESPKERVFPMLAFFFVLGFVVGSFVQPLWDKGVNCYTLGRPLVPCILGS